jgi:hypothetical protein
MKPLFILLLLSVLASCSPDFSKPKYSKRICRSSHGWERRHLPIIKTGTFRNPSIKREARREMLAPKIISFDPW